MGRSKDWLDEAEGDLEHARNDIKGGFYNWACFSAQCPPIWFTEKPVYEGRSNEAFRVCRKNRQVLFEYFIQDLIEKS